MGWGSVLGCGGVGWGRLGVGDGRMVWVGLGQGQG